MSIRILFTCLILITFPAQASIPVVPDNGTALYTGRWDWSEQFAPWAFWKGSSIIVKFKGTGISATFSAGNTDYFRVIIDGKAVNEKISASPSIETYILASGMDFGEHRVEIVKETDVGRWVFYGFELDERASLNFPPSPISRRMVFYGDSNLAGYSLESEQNESAQSLQGSYYGYAGIVSRMFDAEYHNISRSGATIRTLNRFFNQFDYWSRSPTWDFSTEIPEIVVVNIGANDVGRPKARIKSDYHELLDDLRAAHSSAYIVVYNAWGWDFDEPANYTHEVVAERGDPNMSVAVFPWVFEQWHGCEYDHAGMAQVLADHIVTVMGDNDWVQGQRDVMSGFGVNGDIANGGFEETAPFGGYGWRYYTDNGVNRINDSQRAHSGDYYLNLSDGAEVHQPNPSTPGPGDRVSVSALMRGEGIVRITVDYRDQEMWTDPLQTYTEEIPMTSVNTWSQYSVSDITPVDISQPVFHTRVSFTASPGSSVDIDDVEMSILPPGNCDSSRLHVESVTLDTLGVGRGYKVGSATVTVGDNCGNHVEAASVYGVFSGDYTFGTIEQQTDINGIAVLQTDVESAIKGKVSFDFCVVDIILDGLVYDNLEVCKSL